MSRTLRVCRTCHLELPADRVRGCGAVLGHCVGEPGVSCCACERVMAESRLEAERWTEDGDGDWMCHACRGIVECRTRRRRIARVFAEALLRLAGEEES